MHAQLAQLLDELAISPLREDSTMLAATFGPTSALH